MRDDPPIVIMGMLMTVVVIVLSVRKNERKSSTARLNAIRDALRHPGLDDAARSDLVRVLAREELKSQLPRAGGLSGLAGMLMKVWVGAGWCMFAGGGVMLGLWALGASPHLKNDFVLGMTAVGFAMLTLPLAWHEVQSRMSTASAPR